MGRERDACRDSSTRAPKRSCHPARRHAKTLLALVAATVAASGCAVDPDPLTLAPIGAHQVEVGEGWIWAVEFSGAVAPWEVRAIDGPTGLVVIEGTGEARLGWQPTAFDLAPTPPGKPRAPGTSHRLEVEVRDGLGRSATALGSLQAIPATPKQSGP